MSLSKKEKKKSVLGIDYCTPPPTITGEGGGQEIVLHVCHKARGVLVKLHFIKFTLCGRGKFRRNQRTMKVSEIHLWKRKTSLVLKLMKMLEKSTWNLWKDRYRQTT